MRLRQTENVRYKLKTKKDAHQWNSPLSPSLPQRKVMMPIRGEEGILWVGQTNVLKLTQKQECSQCSLRRWRFLFD